MRAWLRACLIAWLALTPAAQGAVEQTAVLASAIERHAASWSPEQFSEGVDDYGKRVSAARERREGPATLAALRASGDELHRACRARIRVLEATTGEDEARLESLYRSEQWHAINYALAGVRYWQAWIDLALADALRAPDQRIPALSRAERGFQATAVRILFPGLVYGSWLGMAYVELARDDVAAAESRLTRLRDALAGDPGNPLADIVDGELAVLRARRGEALQGLPDVGAEITPAIARRLREEAFAILEQRRAHDVIASDAAERLRRVIDAGYLDDALIARMLAWRDEIVGRDMGVIGLLLDAEYAYANGQFETTVLKYREFIAQRGFDLDFDAAPFRYHYAVALYRLGYAREALEVCNNLQQDPALGDDVAKLAFLVAGELNRAQPGAVNRERLDSAAREFLARRPEDPDAALAHLALAAGGSDSAAHLAAARGDPRTRAAVERVRLDAAVQEFGAASLARDWSARTAAAGRALAAIEALPRAQRKPVAMQALSLQMQLAAGQPPPDILQRIATLRTEAGADAGLRRVLAWTELRALAGDPLLARVVQLVASADAADKQELVAFLLELEQRGEYAALEPLCAQSVAGFASQPDRQRQLLLVRYRALAALGRHDEAFAVATDMVGRFAESGDAWRIYAEGAERAGDGFAAERGWAKIAGAVPVGSDHWIEATLRRVALLTQAEGAQPQHCALLDGAGVYRARMNESADREFSVLRQENHC
ncbi:MAG: hypothetical protein IPI75_18380 [Gammaproteobacteria bacterium]|nr:hypothetical protein [Gammaproteobacteria bacterium]